MKEILKYVLLIDDDHATNFIHRKIIEKSQITKHIEVVLNGEEALNYIDKTSDFFESPAIIFLDINMPVMDGWEFLDSYENLKVSQKDKTMIVMMSTSFNPDDKLKAENIKCVDCYKSKPMTYEIIEEIISKYVEAH